MKHVLDLTPRLPKKYLPSAKGVPFLEGPEVGAILRKCASQGFLVVPFEDTDLSIALSNTWWRECEFRQLPFVRVHVKEEGSGHVFFGLWAQKYDLHQDAVNTLCRKIDRLHKGLSEEEVDLIDQAMPSGGYYSMSYAHGFVGFCPSIAEDVVRTIVSHLADQANRVNRS